MRASFELERFERVIAVPGIELLRPVDEHADLRRT
jgi:hypothetical protein